MSPDPGLDRQGSERHNGPGRAGRNLPAAIGVGFALGGIAIAQHDAAGRLLRRRGTTAGRVHRWWSRRVVVAHLAAAGGACRAGRGRGRVHPRLPGTAGQFRGPHAGRGRRRGTHRRVRAGHHLQRHRRLRGRGAVGQAPDGALGEPEEVLGGAGRFDGPVRAGRCRVGSGVPGGGPPPATCPSRC